MNATRLYTEFLNRTHGIRNLLSGRIRVVVAILILVFSVFALLTKKRCSSLPVPGAASVYKKSKEKIPDAVFSYFVKSSFDGALTETVEVVDDADTFNVDLSIVAPLQKRISQLFRQYRPRCGALFVMRPSTGEVLAAVSYRNEKEVANLPETGNMLFWNEYPAASLFKIVTTAGVLEHQLMNMGDNINVTGNLWTLYRHQLTNDKPNRWSRLINMREAFARSINPFFGKVGMYILGTERLNKTADKFLFNHPINFDFPLAASRYVPPKDAFEAAELACGFNKMTTISPVHAAMIAGAVVNGGVVAGPKFIKTISSGEKRIYSGIADTLYAIISKSTSKETMKVMEDVVRHGTARKGFKHVKRNKVLDGVRMGGKTGNLNSVNPRGRCDWFAGFAHDSKKPENSICVAAVTVHGPYWTVHSSYLAAEAINSYFNFIEKQQ